MKLEIEDLKKLCEVAVNAAIKAGSYINQQSKKKFEVSLKEDNGTYASQVYTEVDLKSQEIILEMLAPTVKEYNLALLTEEAEDDGSRFEKDYFWCIDPLDGTLPFIEKKRGFSVSIALVAKDGTPVIGVILDPMMNVLYQAIKGYGIKRNGKPWEWFEERNKYLTFIHDRSMSDDSRYGIIKEELATIATEMGLEKVSTIAYGGGALNAIWVLEHAPACYFKLPKRKTGGGSIWDFAASACIFTETKAYVGNTLGGVLDLNRKDSTFMNHEGVMYASNFQLKKALGKYFQTL